MRLKIYVKTPIDLKCFIYMFLIIIIHFTKFQSTIDLCVLLRIIIQFIFLNFLIDRYLLFINIKYLNGNFMFKMSILNGNFGHS